MRDPRWFPVEHSDYGGNLWSQTSWVEIPGGPLGQVTLSLGLSFLVYEIEMINFPQSCCAITWMNADKI